MILFIHIYRRYFLTYYYNTIPLFKSSYDFLPRCKERHVVNRMMGKVKYVRGNTILIQTSEAIVPVFAVYSNGLEYFPIVAGYASNIHKVMGQTLKYVTLLVFDMQMLSPDVGYVALSSFFS